MVIRFPGAEGLRLDFIRPLVQTQDEAAEDAAGELHACLNRLRFISSLLEELSDAEMEMTPRLEFFVYHVDAYYAAAYRVRDRLQHLPPLRLSADAREKRTALVNLLLPICKERGARVHEWSSSVVAVIGDAPYDPSDLLMEVTRLDPPLAVAVRTRMAWEFARIVGGVQSELQSVADATAAFVNALDLATS
jgi:hypothetical protein